MKRQILMALFSLFVSAIAAAGMKDDFICQNAVTFLSTLLALYIFFATLVNGIYTQLYPHIDKQKSQEKDYSNAISKSAKHASQLVIILSKHNIWCIVIAFMLCIIRGTIIHYLPSTAPLCYHFILNVIVDISVTYAYAYTLMSIWHLYTLFPKRYV